MDEKVNTEPRVSQATLDTISPSFCAAKWYNASIHLGSGETSSCHLPLPHPINVDQLKTNPSAIHNTDHKKNMRKMMLTGIKPAECSYCWKIEDMQRGNPSDRIFKSRQYTIEDVNALQHTPWDADINLKTLEISFDRQCNFACSYCNAGYSSTWAQELETHGAYQNFSDGSGGGAYQSDGSWAESNGKHLENNPYIDAFFEWWPTLVTTLYQLRITGGEASVSQNFWRFIDILHKSDARNMRFAVNTNLGMSPKALEKIIGITKTLPIKEFDLYTSNESYGLHAEYIRDGLQYEIWRSNLITFIENAKFRAVTIMMTINNLCLCSIVDFLDDMMEIKAKHGRHRPNLSLNMLRWPAFMSPLTLPDDLKNQLRGKLQTWYDNNQHSKLFAPSEMNQIQRLLDYIEVVKKGHAFVPDDKRALFCDFKSFFTQYDIRRSKEFVTTFPGMAEWYNAITVPTVFPISVLGSVVSRPFETGQYVAG
tara:strand:- start:622 stop:2064 length:1443 start_codon:yes stop_codon:yes gene_type:complete